MIAPTDEAKLNRRERVKEMETDTKNLPQLLEALGVSAKITPIEHPTSAPKWALDNANAYRVNLSYEGRRAGFYYYAGTGIKHSPSVADVVWSLARDYDSSCYTLEEFGDEFGWDKDTLPTFKAIKKNWAKFTRLFPNPDLRSNIAEIEY